MKHVFLGKVMFLAWALALAACNTSGGGGLVITGDGVSISGDTALIHKAGAFTLSGAAPETKVVVDAAGDVTLILENLSLGSIDVRRADSARVTLAAGKSASLAGNIWSAAALTIDGEGTLAVDAGYDGPGNVGVESQGEFYTAIHSDAELAIEGGNISLKRCYEGLEGAKVVVRGGNITIRSQNDCINADIDSSASNYGHFVEGVDILIEGGTLDLLSESDDDIDAQDKLIISGGTVRSYAPAELLEGPGGTFINGGTVFSTGNTPCGIQPSSTQRTAVIRWDTPQAAGSLVAVKNAGEVIVQWTVPKPFKAVIVSVPSFSGDVTYSVFVNGVQARTWVFDEDMVTAVTEGGL